MKRLDIDFDEIQKAMEDISRDAFDYFLDRETGSVVILSDDIMSRARMILEESYDDDMPEYEEVEFDEDADIPDWMEDEIECALAIFLHEPGRYVRIPERNSQHGYSTMMEFAEGIEDAKLREEMKRILRGKGAFRRFKGALEPHPKIRKQWYGFNAKANRQQIERWLQTVGIEAQSNRET